MLSELPVGFEANFIAYKRSALEHQSGSYIQAGGMQQTHQFNWLFGPSLRARRVFELQTNRNSRLTRAPIRDHNANFIKLNNYILRGKNSIIKFRIDFNQNVTFLRNSSPYVQSHPSIHTIAGTRTLVHIENTIHINIVIIIIMIGMLFHAIAEQHFSSNFFHSFFLCLSLFHLKCSFYLYNIHSRTHTHIFALLCTCTNGKS